MLSPSQVRTIALALPGAEESSHHGTPDFRVRNKIFATLRSEEGISVLKLPAASHAELIRSQPRTFVTNAWSKQGWLGVRLAEISGAEYRELAAIAWRSIAPKKLVKEFDTELGT